MVERRNRWIEIILAVLLMFLATGCASTVKMETRRVRGAFECVGELSPARYGLSSVAVGQDIYLIGGAQLLSAYNGGLLNFIQKFDASTGELVVVKTGIVPRRYHTSVFHKGKIYIMGGVTADRPMGQIRLIETDKVEIYDLATGQISMGAPLPRTRYQAASALVDGKIYLIGGQRSAGLKAGSERPVGSVDIYDIASDSWSRGPSLPVARSCDVAVRKGKIYAVGGYNGMSLGRVDVFDPAVNQWSRGTDIPVPVSAHRCYLMNNKLLVIGDYKILNFVCQYDFETDSWTKIESDFRGCRHHAVATDGVFVYIFGGVRGSGGTGSVGRNLVSVPYIQRISTLKLM